MYRDGTEIYFLPLGDDEIMGTPALFAQMLEKAGYKPT
jgi:hypothetical protein